MVVQNVDFGYSTSTARGLPSDHKSTMKPHRPGINLTATDYKGAKGNKWLKILDAVNRAIIALVRYCMVTCCREFGWSIKLGSIH